MIRWNTSPLLRTNLAKKRQGAVGRTFYLLSADYIDKEKRGIALANDNFRMDCDYVHLGIYYDGV